jgi:hypothetical protein
MLSLNVALVSEVPDVEISELNRIGAAIQKQITRDFGPIWNIQANLSAFARLEDVPVDYWIATLCYGIPEGSGGHSDADGRPAAFIEWTDNWSLTASHEILEMLADPWGKRLIAGPSVKPDQGRVEYLVEVCDPCQSSECAYTVNGEIVSDFYTPNFFDPVSAEGVRYSFSGKITAPRGVLRGGYLSWRDENRHWWQSQWFKGQEPNFIQFGTIVPNSNFRAQIDSVTKEAKPTRGRMRPRLRIANLTAGEAAKIRAERARRYVATNK